MGGPSCQGQHQDAEHSLGVKHAWKAVGDLVVPWAVGYDDPLRRSLPKAFILTEGELQAVVDEGRRVLDLSPEELLARVAPRVGDLVAKTRETVLHMLERPVMYCGSQSAEGIVPMLWQQFALLTEGCCSLGHRAFSSECNLNSLGLGCLIREVRADHDPEPGCPATSGELLPVDEALQNLRNHAEAFFEWIPDHLVLFRETVALKARRGGFPTVPDEEVTSDPKVVALRESFRERLAAVGANLAHVAIRGPYFGGGGGAPEIDFVALNKPYREPPVFGSYYRAGRFGFVRD